MVSFLLRMEKGEEENSRGKRIISIIFQRKGEHLRTDDGVGKRGGNSALCAWHIQERGGARVWRSHSPFFR